MSLRDDVLDGTALLVPSEAGAPPVDAEIVICQRTAWRAWRRSSDGTLVCEQPRIAHAGTWRESRRWELVALLSVSADGMHCANGVNFICSDLDTARMVLTWERARRGEAP